MIDLTTILRLLRSPGVDDATAMDLLQTVVNAAKAEASAEATKAAWDEAMEAFDRVASSRKTAGHRGGLARAQILTPERRSEIAKTAADKRWLNKGTEQDDV